MQAPRGGKARYNKLSYYKTRRAAKSYKSRSGSTRISGYYGRYNNGDNGLNERKFFDTTISFLADATGEVPVSGQLNLIPQGTTESTRIGRKCCIKSIHFRGNQIYTPAADTVGCVTTYVYLVLDKQCNGAAAAVTDVLTSASMPIAMVNMANSERFVILKRWVHKHQAGAGVQAAFGRDIQIMEFYHKCNLPLEFSSTMGAITEIKSNNLFLLAGSDASGDDAVTVNGTVRLRYSDN